jgi:neurotransmitter:Na+ symporter, NSS family
MLQPGIAFLEESMGINRKQSISILGFMTALGTGFVVYFSKDIKALDTIDFWVGTFLIFVLATILIIVFGWVVGIEKGWEEAHRGAEMRIPNFFKFIMKYLSPLYLLTIFCLWLLFNVLGWDPSTKSFNPTGYVRDLVGENPNVVSRLSILLVALVSGFFLLITALAGKRWERIAAARMKQPAEKQ